VINRICLVCDLIWSLTVMAACTYIVFWLNHSGAWYLLAIFLCGAWNCKPYRGLPDESDAGQGGS
jgi:hypothetical protein